MADTRAGRANTDTVISFSIRLPQSLLDKLKAEHRRTYQQHGLTFGLWLREKLEASLPRKPST